MKKIILFITFIITTNAFSYSEGNHALITQYAIDYLNEKYGCDFITEDEAKKLIKGNTSEDHFGHKWSIRLWNQHFYSPLKPVVYWERNKSIDVRFERIAERCFRKSGKKKYYYYIGEILHHIQDVTNPAHVVPVCHGGKIKDRFDEQNVTRYFTMPSSIDTTLVYNAPYLKSILKPIAVKTLKSLDNEFDIKIINNTVENNKTVDWKVFWEEDKNQWFGKYGQLGAANKVKGKKTDNYLKCTIIKGDTTYIIEPKVYTKYSTAQIELAVIQTAQFIYYAKKYRLD